MFFALNLLIFSVISTTATGFEQFLSSVYGDVEKGNFTYYSMSYDGTIMLELVSVKGDCDLYVSQVNNRPTYDPKSYCLQSATCGLDSVIIPKKFKRPVGIGVFAHPSHSVSSYQLSFYRISDSRDIFNYDPYTKPLEMNEKLEENLKQGGGEEESFFWIFLRSFVVFLIECIL